MQKYMHASSEPQNHRRTLDERMVPSSREKKESTSLCLDLRDLQSAAGPPSTPGCCASLQHVLAQSHEHRKASATQEWAPACIQGADNVR